MADDVSIPVLAERIDNLRADISEIKANMANRTDQSHTDGRIQELAAALAAERAERIAADLGAKAERMEMIDREAKGLNVGDPDSLEATRLALSAA